MAQFWQPNTERSVASLYGPQMSRFGAAEGSIFGGPSRGAGAQALQQFGSYQDYLKAYRSNPNQLAGSSQRSYQNPTDRTGSIAYNPFTEAQWQTAEKGRQLASGENLNAAYERALQRVQGSDPLKDKQNSQFFDYYTNLLQNPQDYSSSPEYQWRLQQGEESVRRLSPRLSGARAIAATKYGQGFGQTFRGEDLASRLAAAQEERARFQSTQADRLQRQQLLAKLTVDPELQKYNTYWQTSARA